MNDEFRDPEQDLLATAHKAAVKKARREREETEKRHVHELEEIVLHQPNDFADSSRPAKLIITREQHAPVPAG